MSKSKGNVIAPDELVMHYGADTVRVYLCFLGPYDQGGPWNPSGIEGAARFVRKLHTLLTRPDTNSIEEDKVETALHKLIKKVTEDIPAMKFNTAIAAFMEFTNIAQDYGLSHRQKEVVLKLVAPFCPFIAEELWHILYGKPETESIHHQIWPTYDPSRLIENEVEIVIQVNSRVRGHIIMPRDATETAVQHTALAHNKVIELVHNKEIKKIIYVPHKLINFIVA